MQGHIRNRPSREETGASAMEYGLLIVLIAAVIVVAVFALGGVVRSAPAQSCDDGDTADCGNNGAT